MTVTAKGNVPVQIYTDGACKHNPGPGGWAWVELDGTREIRSGSGGEANTTNNRMELLAVISALNFYSISQPIHVHTDSTYVYKGITEWMSGWKQRNWKTSANKKVANVDLWQVLDDLLVSRKLEFSWVKGHSDSLGNNIADCYASREAHQIAARV